MKGILQAFFLLSLSGVFSFAAFVFHPAAPKLKLENDELSLAQVQSLGTITWIDARTEDEFLSSHLEESLLLNEDDWETHFATFIEQWNPDTSIVVYCSSSACLRSQEVASRLREELGIEEVFVLKGGWQTLLKAGLVPDQL